MGEAGHDGGRSKHGLHIIAIQRQRHDPASKAYIERRRAEGKTDREIRRCLKRYIARELYRVLESGLDSQ